MRTLSIEAKGDFKKTMQFLSRIVPKNWETKWLTKYAEEGLQALKENTPKDTGYTADSWYYEITNTKEGISIVYYNRNVVYESNGVNVAILIQHGHATRNGGWVEGIDYINPSLQPVFDKLAKKIWKEVTR